MKMKKKPKEVPKREIDVFRRSDSLVEVHIGDNPIYHVALYDEEFQELKAKINQVDEGVCCICGYIVNFKAAIEQLTKQDTQAFQIGGKWICGTCGDAVRNRR